MAHEIHILPSQPGVPPQAVLIHQIDNDDRPEGMPPIPEGVVVAQVLEVQWSRDIGTWLHEEIPLDPGLAEQLTEHAKALGVEW